MLKALSLSHSSILSIRAACCTVEEFQLCIIVKAFLDLVLVEQGTQVDFFACCEANRSGLKMK